MSHLPRRMPEICSRLMRAPAVMSRLRLVVGIAADRNMKIGPCPNSLGFHRVALRPATIDAQTMLVRDWMASRVGEERGVAGRWERRDRDGRSVWEGDDWPWNLGIIGKEVAGRKFWGWRWLTRVVNAIYFLEKTTAQGPCDVTWMDGNGLVRRFAHHRTMMYSIYHMITPRKMFSVRIKL
jgi:hypothetical protein